MNPGFSRRDFLKASVASVGISALPRLAASESRAEERIGWIDVNVTLGHWPLRRIVGDDTATLAARLQARQVQQAWAGSFEGLLHRDLAAVNARLAHECRVGGQGLLVPFGSINPTLPEWEEDLRRCAEEHRMPGIRLHPSYHGYTLDAPGFARLLRLAAERSLIVQLALVMEDERMMHPLWRVPPVDATPLARIVTATPGLRLVLLNALGRLRGEALRRMTDAGEVFCEISMLEGVGGVERALEHISLDRLLFGSHAPLFYFEAAVLKLQESPLTAAQEQAIRRDNARRLIQTSGRT